MKLNLYDRIGVGNSEYRRPDPRIAAQIVAALNTSRSVLNVGAGSGSYEPEDRFVAAVDPSAEMLRQRKRASSRAIQARAERLPIRDSSLDATLAILTVHHWSDWRRGLYEMARVARNRIVVLTWDPEHEGFWLVREYFPEILDLDRLAFPSMGAIESVIGPIDVRAVGIPADCSDGFLGAYWRRPSAYLDAGVRRAISTFAKLPNVEPGLRRLQKDLADGMWQERHQELLAEEELDIGYRLIVASSASA